MKSMVVVALLLGFYSCRAHAFLTESLTLTESIDNETCVKEGPCKCRTSKGIVDLNPLQNGSVPVFSWVFDGDGVLYYFNPCSDFSNDYCTDAAVCQVANASDHDAGINCGKASDTRFGSTNEHGRLYIDYMMGDGSRNKRRSRVVCVCNQNVNAILEAFGAEGSLQYDFTLTSKYCCLVRRTSGLSAGSIFLIIFFAFVIAYFFAGTIVMKFAKGAQGSEIVPHRDFWFAIPSLIKTGIIFVFCCGKVDKGNYSAL